MDDLISRKKAIDACMKYNGYGSVWACIMGDIKQLPSVTIKDTADEIKVTNGKDNISRQAICDALDKVFADRIKSAGFDSYETADRDTQLVCDGIMKAIDVVLDMPTAQPEVIPLKWIDEHLEWLGNCDNDFAQIAKISIRSMVELWKVCHECGAERRTDERFD